MRKAHGLNLGPLLTDERFVARFWSKVDEGSDCWEWKAYTNRAGYGQFTVSKGVFTTAHRVAWALANKAAIPPGAHICHHCDNPPCVRPDHLFLGDASINLLDCVAKGRKNPSHGSENRSAKLTEQDVRAIRSVPQYFGIYNDLARTYGVSNTAIRCVRRNTTWRHVA